MTNSGDQSALLEEVLTRAELRYRIDSSGGHAFAEVHKLRNNGLPQRYVVTLQGGILGVCTPRLSRAATGSDLLRQVNALNQEFPLGRIYLDAEHELFAAVCFLASGSTDPCAGFQEALGTLHNALDFLEAGIPPPLMMPLSAAPALGIGAVEIILRELGYGPQPAFDGGIVGFGLRDEDGTHTNIELWWATDDLLAVRGSHSANVTISDPDHALTVIQEINAKVGVGAVVLDGRSQRAHYKAHISRRWVPMNATSIDWHVLRAVGAMTALNRRLPQNRAGSSAGSH